MFNITFTLDKTKKIPIYEQLYKHIAEEIRHGAIAEGERLPSKKSLAEHLGISVNTVETAYAILLQEGYITAKARSGYYVQKVEAHIFDEVKTYTANEVKKDKYRIDFKTNAVDVGSFPYATWVKLSKEVMYSNPELLNVGDFKGDRELRESIAKYLHEFRGVRCGAENIVIGAGIEYLLTLLTLILHNKKYAVENPGYAKTECIFENSQNAVHYIPVDECGMSIKALRSTNADIAYITPSHQFPTGTVMPVGRRMELLRWASEKEGRYIIEDDYNGEFNFGIKPIPAVQGLIESSRVIYLSTFSRILAPSIRISYMVLPNDLMAEYEKKFFGYTSTVPRFEQHTLNRFIEGGYFSRHLNRVKNIYKKRCDALLSLLNEYDVEISGEKAGLHLLLTTPKADMIAENAEKSKIRLYRLDDYYFAPPEDKSNTLIIGYGGCQESDFEKLKNILNKTLK